MGLHFLSVHSSLIMESFPLYHLLLSWSLPALRIFTMRYVIWYLMDFNIFSLKGWPTDQWHPRLLGICWKCKISGLTQDLLNQYFSNIPTWFVCIMYFKKHSFSSPCPHYSVLGVKWKFVCSASPDSLIAHNKFGTYCRWAAGTC